MENNDNNSNNSNSNNSEIDRSFKGWLKLMWGEMYIQLFIIFLCASIFIPVILGKDYLAIDLLFGTVMLVIAYKGFYKRWLEYINNKTS